ncbi:MerR family transcriptional regulator [Bifidobacterium sp.]|uniref:MerR family transcriptional regulator n=1 Tax=Bifidobacterium sp. TaxID=41200 RepID=UPI0025C49DBE|nr:MerR family transcriptional regulator [Bifidobacterium sp.]MCI1635517.1 MerR family transcriptional regulator [Bifidobacterium sp.]
MATEALVRRLMDCAEGNPDSSTVEVLRELMNDSTIESSASPLSIAQAAKLLNTSVYTLRYYEQQSLVHPDRNASGYREYSAFALRRLVFISRMRVSGMTMGDLKRYIALVEQGDATIEQRRQLMIEQRSRIQRQINELSLALEVTDYKIETYHAVLGSQQANK